MVQAHSWQSKKAPASPIWLLHPGISHLLRQSRAKLPQTETFIPPLEPEELKQQESRSSSSYVPRVLRVKCGLGQGTGGCRWWQGPSSDLDSKGVCLDTPHPPPPREGLCRHPCGNPAHFSSGVRSYFLLQNDLIVIFAN